MSEVSKSTRPSKRAAITAALVVVGLLGLAWSEQRRLAETLPVVAEGSFWACYDESGAILAAPRSEMLGMPKNARFESKRQEDARTQYRTVRLVAQRSSENTSIEFAVRERDGKALIVQVGARADTGVFIGYRDVSGEIVKLTKQDKNAPDFVGPPYREFAVELLFAGDILKVKVNGVDAAMTKTQWGPVGKFSIAARNGLMQIRDLRVNGVREFSAARPEGEPFEDHVEFRALPGQPGSPLEPPSVVPDLLREAGIFAAFVAFVALWLRAFCLGRPSLKVLLRAVVVFLAPACVYFLLGFAKPVNPFASINAVLFPVGFVLALTRLGPAVRGAASPGLFSRIRPWLVAAPLVLVAAHSVAGYAERFYDIGLQIEQACATHPRQAPHEHAEPVALALDSAYTVNGKYRDFDLSMKLTLEPDAIGFVRLRAGRIGAEGIGLVLSSDPRMESGFVVEGRTIYDRVGTSEPIVPARKPLDIVIHAASRHFEATIDGKPFASADVRLYGEGSIGVMTHVGSGTLSDVKIDVPAVNAPAATSTPDQVTAVVPLLAFWLGYALLCALCLHVPFARAAEAAAFALIPVALMFDTHAISGGFDAWVLVGALWIASFPLLLYPLVHSARMRGPLYLIFVAWIASADVMTYRAATARAWPPGDDATNAIAIDEWNGSHIERDFLHLEHPLVRRWNDWLGMHEFRARRHSLKKEPGVVRIVSLGTSSTYGYRATEPYGHRLETKLKAEGKNVEIIVAAWPGASGSRLLSFFENVVLKFEPDILVLSLYHNDAVALSQVDEMTYFERITAPGYERSLLDRWNDRLEVRNGATRLKRWLDEMTSAKGMKEPSAVEGVSPPARWKAMLDGFVRVTAEHGVKLVLVKEPVIVVEDDRIWRRQFFAVMEQVAVAAKVPVLDPLPDVQRAGGQRLFMDQVHPYDPGHEVIADSLLPGVRDVVDQVVAERGK